MVRTPALLFALVAAACLSCETGPRPLVANSEVDGAQKRNERLCAETYQDEESRSLCLRWFGALSPDQATFAGPPEWPLVARGCAWHALQTQGVHSTPKQNFENCVARLWYDPSPHPRASILLPPTDPRDDRAECAQEALQAVTAYEHCMVSEGWPESRTGLNADPLASARSRKLNANSFARVSFLLLGVLLIVEFLFNLGSSFSQGPLVFAKGEVEPDSILANAGFTLLARATAGLLFNLIPGLVLLYKGTDWADRLVAPSDESSSYIEFQALLSIGLSLLGYYFIISGLAGAVGGVVSVAFADEYGRELAWKQAASSLTLLVSGLVVATIGRRSG